MKAAKYILCMIVTCAFIGGILAYKSARFGLGNLYHVTAINNTTTCTLHSFYRSNITFGASTTVAPDSLYYSINNLKICANPFPTRSIIYVAPVQ
jgi:hypothetical protein